KCRNALAHCRPQNKFRQTRQKRLTRGIVGRYLPTRYYKGRQPCNAIAPTPLKRKLTTLFFGFPVGWVGRHWPRLKTAAWKISRATCAARSTLPANPTHSFQSLRSAESLAPESKAM